MSSINTATSVTNVAAPATRLIDLGVKLTMWFQMKVVVLGNPGSGTEEASAWLKMMGFKVYDFAESAKNYERDFALMLEAAELKKAGQPYDKLDVYKFLGKYDAVVGIPANFCIEELGRVWPKAKYIMVNEKPDATKFRRYRQFTKSAALCIADPDFFGKLSALNGAHHDTLDKDLVRKIISSENLLEVEKLDCKTMCTFINRPMVEGPIQDIKDATMAVYEERLSKVATRVGKTAGEVMTGVKDRVVTTSVAMDVVETGLAWDQIQVSSGMSVGLMVLLFVHLFNWMKGEPEPEPVVVAAPVKVAVAPSIQKPAPIAATKKTPPQQGRQQQGRNQGRNRRGPGQANNSPPRGKTPSPPRGNAPFPPRGNAPSPPRRAQVVAVPAVAPVTPAAAAVRPALAEGRSNWVQMVMDGDRQAREKARAYNEATKDMPIPAMPDHVMEYKPRGTRL
jgi:hypothetical protein